MHRPEYRTAARHVHSGHFGGDADGPANAAIAARIAPMHGAWAVECDVVGAHSVDGDGHVASRREGVVARARIEGLPWFSESPPGPVHYARSIPRPGTCVVGPRSRTGLAVARLSQSRSGQRDGL